MSKKVEERYDSFFSIPWVGTFFTVTAGLAFLVLCMILPIVGPAAMRGSGSPGATTAEWATKNYMAFLGVLIICLVLSALAVWSKFARRKIDNSPLPKFSIGLFGLCVLILVALVSGLLKI